MLIFLYFLGFGNLKINPKLNLKKPASAAHDMYHEGVNIDAYTRHLQNYYD